MPLRHLKVRQFMICLSFVTFIFVLDHGERFCYSCLDVNLLRYENHPNASTAHFYDGIVSLAYGGINPSHCSDPELIQCEREETCFSIDTTVGGTC